MLLLLPKLIYLMKTLYFRKKKLKDKRLIVLLNSCGISVSEKNILEKKMRGRRT